MNWKPLDTNDPRDLAKIADIKASIAQARGEQAREQMHRQTAAKYRAEAEGRVA